MINELSTNKTVTDISRWSCCKREVSEWTVKISSSNLWKTFHYFLEFVLCFQKMIEFPKIQFSFFNFYSSLLLCFVMYELQVPLNNVYYVIFTVQWLMPLLIEISINFEAYKKKNLGKRIEESFNNLEKSFCKNSDSSKVNFPIFTFVIKFVVLLTVRTFHIRFGPVLLSTATMFTELVCSANDYAFVFKVNLLRIQIKSFSCSLMSERVEKLNVQEDFLAFHKLSKLLCKRYCVGLLLNVVLNFIIIIISLYWIFIRMAFNRLKLKSLFLKLLEIKI